MRHCPTSARARRSHEFVEVFYSHTDGSHDDRTVCFSPMRLLRTFPPLEALPVIGIAVTLVRDLPTDLYDELVKHPYEIRAP